MQASNAKKGRRASGVTPSMCDGDLMALFDAGRDKVTGTQADFDSMQRAVDCLPRSAASTVRAAMQKELERYGAELSTLLTSDVCQDSELALYVLVGRRIVKSSGREWYKYSIASDAAGAAGAADGVVSPAAAPAPAEGTKRCEGCGEVLPLNSFPERLAKFCPDGHARLCFDCIKRAREKEGGGVEAARASIASKRDRSAGDTASEPDLFADSKPTPLCELSKLAPEQIAQLEAVGIETVEDLCQYTRADLLDSGIAPGPLARTVSALEHAGYCLADPESEAGSR